MPDTRLRGRWMQRPWGRMRIWDAGPAHAPVLLAIHGLGGSGRYWQGLADRVGDRFRIVAPDLAGFGRSDEPEEDANRALHLDDLDAVADDVAGSSAPLVVVGHSLGGVLAVLWVALHVDRVSALAAAAPAYPSGQTMDFRSRADLRASPARRVLARGVSLLWPVIAVPFGVVRGYPAPTVVDFGRQSVRSRAWTLWSLWSDPDLKGEAIAASTAVDAGVPHVLLLHARDDRTVSFDAHGAWLRLLPSAEQVVVDHGGHQFLLRGGIEPLADWLRALPDARPAP